MTLNDEQFFNAHPDRQARIRMPEPYNECYREFGQLGDHPSHRRRLLVWRVPKDNKFYDPKRRPLLVIPFLAFADETIENRDDVLLPIIGTIMFEQLRIGGNA